MRERNRNSKHLKKKYVGRGAPASSDSVQSENSSDEREQTLKIRTNTEKKSKKKLGVDKELQDAQPQLSSSHHTETNDVHRLPVPKNRLPFGEELLENDKGKLLEKENSNSSSSREFQRTKRTRCGVKTLRKLSEENTKVASMSNTPIGMKKRKTAINQEQSFHFKSQMAKVFSKIKDLCTDFELHIEHVKCFKFRKEIKYLENANTIAHKVMELVTKLKIDLNHEQEQLHSFQESWCKACTTKDSMEADDDDDDETEDREDNDSDTIETHGEQSETEDPINQEESEAISECDTSRVFPSNTNEEETTGLSKDTSVCTDGSKNQSPPAVESKETTESGIDESKTASCVLHRNRSQQGRDSAGISEANESIDHMFDSSVNCDSSVVEPADKTTDSHQESVSLEEEIDDFVPASEGEDESRIVSSSRSIRTLANADNKAGKKVQICHTTSLYDKDKLDESNKLDKLDTTEEDIFTESSPNLDPLIGKLCTESENDSRIWDASLLMPPKDEGETDLKKVSSDDEDASGDNESIRQKECAAKRALLNSNSDSDTLDSIPDGLTDTKEDVVAEESCSANLRTGKASPEVDSDEESSNSEPEETEAINHKKDLEEIVSDEEPKKDSLEKDNGLNKLDVDVPESGVVARVKSRHEQLRNRKYLDENSMDTKLLMNCSVRLTRLAKDVLEKYKKTLEKSRQRLRDKKLESLINLEKLEKMNNTNRVRTKDKNRSRSKVSSDEDESLLDHLYKVEECPTENDLNLETVSDANDNEKSQLDELDDSIKANDELITWADQAAKDNLLNSSDTDLDQQKARSNSSASEDEKKENTEASAQKDARKDKSSKSSKESQRDRRKSKWQNDEILTMRLSDSDSNNSTQKRKKKKMAGSSASAEEDLSNVIIEKKKKRRIRRRILESDSDPDSDFDADSADSQNSSDTIDTQNKKGKKRNLDKASESDSSHTEKPKRVKRRRVKQMSSDSNSDTDQKNADGEEDMEHLNSSQGGSDKKGRKNIRKVLKDKQVAADTKQAGKEEEERIKRISERQKLYNEMYEMRLASEKKIDKLVLDFDPDTKEELVSVHKEIVKHLKPHQADGIRFMWDCCFESIQRAKESAGSGCILAHCMGLGKTLQVVALVHTLLSYDEIGITKIMIVCPLSTVLNWVNEFQEWLKNVENVDDIDIYELTKSKKNIERIYQLQSWRRTGGVLIIGYDMFRNLTGANKAIKKKMKETILECLVDPGPDIVICDEGHLLKNEDTALSKCMRNIKTRRRIVLTGTPLQNNLIEYHCMVQFVKPNLLGTKKEFSNRFAHPITNGQFDDSTAHDVKIMKKRAYVLHKMLKGSIQRFDYSVLTPFLPPKQEYVISVPLSEVQIKLYRHYLLHFARQHHGSGGTLFADFQALQRIWTHPLVLRFNAERIEKNNEKNCLSESEGSLKDFIDDDSDTETLSSSSSSSNDDEPKPGTTRTTRRTRNNDVEEEVPEVEFQPEKPWWNEYVQPEHFEDMRTSSKLVLLFGILQESEQIGDKLLVFSQSLYSLRLIEEFLERINNESRSGDVSENLYGHSGTWYLGIDYFRLDGQTSAENRNKWCKIFNQPTNTRARLFLISTRAGGLGINLTAANRAVIFDASWNPSHDVQSIFRIYRFGQKKPCYVYRFLAAGTMEEKIYSRQVTKLSLSCRVVDEQQIERHYTNHALSELYTFEPNLNTEKPTLNLPKDRLLAEIFLKYKDYVENYHEHDSLLENKTEEELDEEERKQAWEEYDQERKGTAVHQAFNVVPNTSIPGTSYGLAKDMFRNIDYQGLQQLIRKDYPNATPEQQQQMTARAVREMYAYYEQQTVHHNSSLPNLIEGLLPAMLSQPIQSVPHINTAVPNPYAYNKRVLINTPSTADDDVVEMSPAATAPTITQDPQNQPQSVNMNKGQEE